ncbi:hypothetical protein D6810_00455 [Candidatus Dojkabacteria bacterium]|uniref:Uncharacterized protein n=1 Tax=Candidatus Dojkabacteria bacterium TaxID=2099670 RepID=A0A3M0Z3U7_9BACT|nr:MAG: hypothetical protein D6810_00455 [Candidatus Dojkabacteria bacterium]
MRNNKNKKRNLKKIKRGVRFWFRLSLRVIQSAPILRKVFSYWTFTRKSLIFSPVLRIVIHNGKVKSFFQAFFPFLLVLITFSFIIRFYVSYSVFQASENLTISTSLIHSNGKTSYSGLGKDTLFIISDTDFTYPLLNNIQVTYASIHVFNDDDDDARVNIPLPPTLLLDDANKVTVGNYFGTKYVSLNEIDFSKELSNYARLISDLLGIHFDNIVIIASEDFRDCANKTLSELIDCNRELIKSKFSLFKNFFESFLFFLRHDFMSYFKFIRSNLNLGDTAKLVINFTNDTYLNQIFSVYKEVGNGFTFLDKAEYIKLISPMLTDSAVKNEQALIEVYNASQHKGIATLNAFYLQLRGLNIVRVGNYNRQNKNFIFLKGQEDLDRFKSTLDLLHNYFGGEYEIKTEGLRLNSIGDIVVIIGSL